MAWLWIRYVTLSSQRLFMRFHGLWLDVVQTKMKFWRWFVHGTLSLKMRSWTASISNVLGSLCWLSFIFEVLLWFPQCLSTLSYLKPPHRTSCLKTLLGILFSILKILMIVFSSANEFAVFPSKAVDFSPFHVTFHDTRQDIKLHSNVIVESDCAVPQGFHEFSMSQRN